MERVCTTYCNKSDPAGLGLSFALYTGLGAGLWMTVLVLLGYFLGTNQTMINHYLSEFTWGVVAFVVVSSLLYYWWTHRDQG